MPVQCRDLETSLQPFNFWILFDKIYFWKVFITLILLSFLINFFLVLYEEEKIFLVLNFLSIIKSWFFLQNFSMGNSVNRHLPLARFCKQFNWFQKLFDELGISIEYYFLVLMPFHIKYLSIPKYWYKLFKSDKKSCRIIISIIRWRLIVSKHWSVHLRKHTTFQIQSLRERLLLSMLTDGFIWVVMAMPNFIRKNNTLKSNSVAGIISIQDWISLRSTASDQFLSLMVKSSNLN